MGPGPNNFCLLPVEGPVRSEFQVAFFRWPLATNPQSLKHSEAAWKHLDAAHVATIIASARCWTGRLDRRYWVTSQPGAAFGTSKWSEHIWTIVILLYSAVFLWFLLMFLFILLFKMHCIWKRHQASSMVQPQWHFTQQALPCASVLASRIHAWQSLGAPARPWSHVLWEIKWEYYGI